MVRMTRVEMLRRMIVALFVVALSAGVAVAADASSVKNACADDVAKYCKDVKPGGGRIARCLKANENQLSPACKSSIEESKRKIREAHQACDADVQKFCKDVQPGQGRLIKCLREHDKELSAECRAKMSEPRKR